MLQPREPGAVADAGGRRSGACVAHGGELGRSSAFFLFFPHGLASSVALHVHLEYDAMVYKTVNRGYRGIFIGGNTFFHSTNGVLAVIRVERHS